MTFLYNNFLSILLISVLLIILILLLIELFRLELNSVYKKIRKEIRLVVFPKVAIRTPNQNEMIDFAISVWRIEKGLTNIKKSSDDADTKRIENSVEKMKEILKDNNIVIIDHTGEKYNDGRNLEVYDVEKDSSIENPMVVKTIEPSIMSDGCVIQKGKVVIKQ